MVVFAGGVLGSLAIQKQTHLSIFETIARLPLAELANLTSGPLSRATIGDLLAGTGAVVIGWCGSRLTLRMTFSVAAKATDLWKRTSTSMAEHRPDEKLSLEDRKKALELIDAGLEEPRSLLRRYNSVTEMLSGFAVLSLLVAHWGNALDLSIGLALGIAVIFCNVGAVRLFLRDFYGPALYRAQLVGKRPPHLSNVA